MSQEGHGGFGAPGAPADATQQLPTGPPPPGRPPDGRPPPAPDPTWASPGPPPGGFGSPPPGAAPPDWTPPPAAPPPPWAGGEPPGPFGGPTGPPPPPPPTASRPPGPRPEADRPRPRLAGTVAAVGGVLVVVGFGVLLDRLPGTSSQGGGLGWSALLLLLGIASMVLLRGRAAITAGVAVTALAVLPLVVYAIVDPENPDEAAGSLSELKRSVALGLALLALGWLVGWLVGPGRRHAVYLGAGLVSAWLAVMVMVGVPNEEPDLFFSSGESFVPVDPGFEEEPFVDPYEGDPFDEEPPFAEDAFGDPTFDEPSFVEPDSDDLVASARIAGVSLVIGVAYAAAAAVADRLRHRRGASAAWLAAAVALATGLLFLGDTGVQVWGAAVVGVFVGGALMALGAAGLHRFTTWNGGAIALIALGVLVADRLGDSTLVSGIVLMVIGILLAVGAALAGGLDPGAAPPPPIDDGVARQPGAGVAAPPAPMPAPVGPMPPPPPGPS